MNHPELERFLAKPQNIAIVPDFVQLEAIKSNDIDLVRERISILARFTNQVKIPKSTHKVCGLNGRTKGLRKRLICKHQTNNFRSFCSHINDTSGRQKHGQDAFIYQSFEASEFIENSANSVHEFIDIYQVFETQFTQHEIKLIRQNKLPSKETFKKLFALVAMLAGNLFERLPNCSKWPKDSEWPNLFIHRNSLFNCLYFLEWMKKGSPKGFNHNKLSNDIIDLNLCTYATYFDGILTKDKNCYRRYEEGNTLLKYAIIPYLKS